MSRKIVYIALTALLAVATNVVLILNDKFNWIVCVVCVALYVVFAFGHLFPNKFFRFTHWYLNKDLDDCVPAFITAYKVIIGVCLFLCAVVPIYQLAPIVL